jgi:parallel beta-helix repeat protein
MSLADNCGESPSCMEFVSGTGTGNSIVISNNFPLDGGVNYTANARVRAPAGTQLKLVVRRGGPTYESLAADQRITASGSWQTVSYTFRSIHSVPNGRFDIEVPGGRIKINLREVHVQRMLPSDDVMGVFVEGSPIRRAHHPNYWREGENPDSPYGVIALPGGKRIVDTTGLTLPANGTLSPGLGVSIRVNNFALEEKRVAAVSGSRLTLDSDTYYPITSGHGYFLTGAPWMVDSPGEWHFDPSTGELLVWTPDGNAPGNRISFNPLPTGINLRGRAYIHLTGLKVARFATGVQLGIAKSINLRGITINDIADHAVVADNCRACKLEQSNVVNTGLDAIRAVGLDTAEFVISGSRVVDSGALNRTDGWRKLPRPARAAINIGENAATIENSEILRSANNGIFLGPYSSIKNSHVSYTCVVFNDCGGIYANFAGHYASITENVVDNVIGGLIGLPPNAFTQTAGIYLDDFGANVQVLGNTVNGGDFGIHVHNVRNSTIANNIVFGSRRYQIWMQEQFAKIRPEGGDLFGNQIDSNLLVPLGSGPALFMESEVGPIDDFGTFSNNHYSALLSARPISKLWPNGSISYSFSEWQGAGQDLGGRATQAAGYAAFLSKGANMVPNGNLADSWTGWTWWNLTAPHAQPSLMNCSFGPCLKFTAGASPSLLSSPNFSVVKGQWYRVSFDAATSHENQPIVVQVRRGGGSSTNFDPVMEAAESFTGSPEWRRYSFVFRSTKTITANDPAGELGARVDFERIQPGSSITVARLEVVPLEPAQAALQLRLQLNPSDNVTDVPCSSADEAANLCHKFVYMKDHGPINWSALVDARSGNVLYTRDTSLVDADSDGVADVEDGCPETRPGTSVNAQGCGFDQ